MTPLDFESSAINHSATCPSMHYTIRQFEGDEMATTQKETVKRPVGCPTQPMPKIDASFEEIIKAVVTPTKKD